MKIHMIMATDAQSSGACTEHELDGTRSFCDSTYTATRTAARASPSMIKVSEAFSPMESEDGIRWSHDTDKAGEQVMSEKMVCRACCHRVVDPVR